MTYDIEELKNFKSNTILSIICGYCNATITRDVRHLKYSIKKNKSKKNFCNSSCAVKFFNKENKRNCKTVQCSHCLKAIIKQQCQLKISKSGNSFCSLSCSAKYNNAHKKYGTKRSKLEIWLQEQIGILFPNLQILYCNKEVIKSELDIYIPSLNLAFELNGIFHYEPIFGPEKLSQIQNNDGRKFQACLERGIELVIIDTVSAKNGKNYAKFLAIIKDIIDNKIAFSQ